MERIVGFSVGAGVSVVGDGVGEGEGIGVGAADGRLVGVMISVGTCDGLGDGGIVGFLVLIKFVGEVVGFGVVVGAGVFWSPGFNTTFPHFFQLHVTDPLPH